MIQDCYAMVDKYFNHHPKKTWLWFQERNSALDFLTPLEMIKLGKVKKLYRFIQLLTKDN